MFTGDDHDRDGWITSGEIETYTLKAGNLNGGPSQWGLRLDSREPGDIFARLRYRIGSYRLMDATFGVKLVHTCGYSFPGPETETVTVETMISIDGGTATFSRPNTPPSYGGFTYCSDYASLMEIDWQSDVTVAESFGNGSQPTNVPAPPAAVFLLTAMGGLGGWRYARGRLRGV